MLYFLLLLSAPAKVGGSRNCALSPPDEPGFSNAGGLVPAVLRPPQQLRVVGGPLQRCRAIECRASLVVVSSLRPLGQTEEWLVSDGQTVDEGHGRTSGCGVVQPRKMLGVGTCGL